MKIIIAKRGWLDDSDLRLDASFHLSEGQLTLTAFKKAKIQTEPLHKVTEKIFYGGRSRRIYVNKPENGLPFIKGADIIKSDFSSLKTISKKRTANLNEYFLEEGWTLITRSGTIGNTAYVNKDFIGKAASDDIIRVVPRSVLPGFLYAFLTSKNGKALLTHGTYGAVIQHIEPEHIENIPIPIFSPQKQKQIHDLIVQAGEFRVNGNKSLRILRKEIEQLIERELNLNLIDHKKYASVSLGNIIQFEKRFDAPYYSDLGRKIFERIIPVDNVSISSVSEVFHPILFGKKQLKGTSLKGNALFKSSSMMQLKPETDFWLSLKKVESYSKLQVKKGWVLVSRTGTVGNVVRISERQNDIFIDDHMIRIIPKENYSGLIYIYLSSTYGKELIKFQKYGSVQDVINSDYIGRIPIPKFLTQNALLKRVQEVVEDAHKMIDKANIFEQEAIQLIETEIAQWQQ